MVVSEAKWTLFEHFVHTHELPHQEFDKLSLEPPRHWERSLATTGFEKSGPETLLQVRLGVLDRF